MKTRCAHRLFCLVPLLLMALGLATPLRAAAPLPWHQKLNEWRFDDYHLPTVYTGAPQAAFGFTLAPSWNTNALRLAGQDGALVQYPIFRMGGRTNLVCDLGTVRFYYRPLWTSTTLGGSGPVIMRASWRWDCGPVTRAMAGGAFI